MRPERVALVVYMVHAATCMLVYECFWKGEGEGSIEQMGARTGERYAQIFVKSAVDREVLIAVAETAPPAHPFVMSAMALVQMKWNG